MKIAPPDTLAMKSGGLCSERVWAWSVKDVMEQAESQGAGTLCWAGPRSRRSSSLYKNWHNDLDIAPYSCHGKLHLSFHFVPSVSRSLPIRPAKKKNPHPSVTHQLFFSWGCQYVRSLVKTQRVCFTLLLPTGSMVVKTFDRTECDRQGSSEWALRV